MAKVDYFRLGKAQVGDRFKFSSRGIWWIVIHRHDIKHPDFNSVIEIKSEKGTIKTYSDKHEAWNRRVIY